MDWTYVETEECGRRRKKFAKCDRELTNLFGNFELYASALREGRRPMQLLTLPFVHSEPSGVHALDARPKKPNFRELRLYVYPNASVKEIRLLLIGDKNSQNEDVTYCKSLVRRLDES